MSSAPANVRLRQPWLFAMNGPMGERLGGGFFAGIPTGPGVYRFFGDNDRLLYIGQSSNLRARIGSYRFVTAERHPRRTARLVAAIRRVEWSVCESAAEAVSLESALLLEHRPPFNRAGVWKPPPWWLVFEEDGGSLRVRMVREEPDANTLRAGPLLSSFRYVFAPLMRCVYRRRQPHAEWWSLPHGMAGPLIPPEQSIPVTGEPVVSAEALRRFVVTGCPEFLAKLLEALPAGDAFWEADREALQKFSAAAADAPAS